MTLSPEFPCNQCGACCRNVGSAIETQFLDRGDGICQYYHTESKLCTIYESRPLICQINKQYLLNYKTQYSWLEFIELNREACLILERL
ncbi:zinc/iron-chelating domain-containing protein [Shewanella xiamenensis]|uniref:YkgJ family cysteine cluster protein n=1 Tax=Shewanella TaxID=22 RepID=UPI001C4E1E2F|nr:zinc/iron-chelating domain-containing protein [Shewanella xiamenensis]MBW0296587.1 zinc/iron-chelating domain-containing protein [Shewanella xiamenensis]MCT8873389.1 YkgJ family cysteine cluster protein [Shewanella xiamenensis]UWH42542.1 YkgJ family cysteine cluster protein [Shewanella xiamenensis]